MSTNRNLSRYAFRFSTMAFAFLSVSPILFAAVQEAPTFTREKLLQAVEKARREKIGVLQDVFQNPKMTVPKELLPDFVALLQDNDPGVQCVGIAGLYILKMPESKEPLVEYLRKKDFTKFDKMASNKERFAVYGAVVVLGDVGDKSVIPLLESLRGVEGLELEFSAHAAHEALAKLGREGIESLRKPGFNDVGKAADAIRGVKDPKQIPALIATVKDSGCAEGLRAAALGALGGMKRDDTFLFLMSVVNDEQYSDYLRETAVNALGRYPSPEAEKFILRKGIVSGGRMRASCLIVLSKRDQKHYLPDVFKFLLDPTNPLDQRVRVAEFTYYSHEHRLTSELRELMTRCLKAETEDGKPADLVRVYVWRAFNKATGEEPRLEVSDEKIAGEKLADNIEESFQRAEPQALLERLEELRRLAREKVKTILVKWQPQKGGSK